VTGKGCVLTLEPINEQVVIEVLISEARNRSQDIIEHFVGGAFCPGPIESGHNLIVAIGCPLCCFAVAHLLLL
jgi:hypothetical protein